MAWRGPKNWVQPAGTQDLQAGSNPISLGERRDAGKFTVAVQGYEAAAPALCAMPVAMQRNRRTRLLHRAHPLPERLIVLAGAKTGVPIVGNNSQYRPESEFVDERSQPQP
jgi:hypothetical protein